MNIELTQPQQQALDSADGTPRFTDPRTNTDYVLIPVDDFEAVREAIEDERRQRAIRRTGLRNAAGRMEAES